MSNPIKKYKKRPIINHQHKNPNVMKKLNHLKRRSIRLLLILNVICIINIPAISLAQESFTEKATMPTPRSALCTAALDGKIYAIGGLRNEEAVLSAVEVYDPAKDTWDTKTPMPTARCVMDCAVVEGKIYVIGGSGSAGSSILSTLEVYNPAADTWETKTPMPAPRSDISVEAVNGKIYVIGGSKRTGTYWAGLKTVEEYDPVTDSWTTKSEMPTARWSLGTCVIDGKIYTVGGNTQYPTIASAVEVYDPATDTWDTSKASMPTSRYSLSTCFFDGKIFAFGGWKASGGNNGNPPMYKIVEEYNVNINTWTQRTDMPHNIALFSAELVDGEIYIIGGTSKQHTFNSLSTTYEYNPNSMFQIPEFIRIETGALVQDIGNSQGSALADFDNDGDIDLLIGNSSYLSTSEQPVLLYKNERKGNFLRIRTGDLATQNQPKMMPTASLADIDNDGDWDVSTPCVFYLNDGYGIFTKQYLDPQSESGCGDQIVTWSDINQDGYLDMYIWRQMWNPNTLYLSNGNGTFSQVFKDVLTTTPANSESLSWSDFDNDGDMDVFSSNHSFSGAQPQFNRNFCFINHGGTFSLMESTRILVQDTLGSAGASWGDYDNDGDLDLYVSTMRGTNHLYKNDGTGNFTQLTIDPEKAIDKGFLGSAWGDFDNDGDLDLFVTSDQNNLNGTDMAHFNMLFQNNGDGSFTEIATSHLKEDGGHSCTLLDYDNDGDLDILVPNGSLGNPKVNYIYSNEGNNNNWININCKGTVSNASAIGSRIYLKATIGEKPVWQMRELAQQTGLHSFSSPRFHFGLGDATKIDSLIIQWSSGIKDTYLDVNTNQFYYAIEDSLLEIDFKATNYIQLSPYFDDVILSESGESKSIDLKDHYKLITGDTVPIFIGDTLVFTLHGNENQDAVNATIEGSVLTLNTGISKGKSDMQVIASAGFTSRMDQFTVINNVTSIQSIAISPSILIYPNPLTGIFNISFGSQVQQATLNIFDLQGRLMRVETFQNPTIETFDIGTLPKGIYIVSGNIDEKKISTKISLQ